MGVGSSGNGLSQGSCFSALPEPSTLNHGMQLVTTDGKKTVIAKFHRARCCWKKRKARLEVQPEGMAMLDDIVLTFVYVERQRRKREAAAKSAGG